MLLSAQLLGGLLARREQVPLAGPAIRHELSNAPHGPAVLELVENVDEIVSRSDAEPTARLHKRVSVSKSLRGVRRSSEVKVAPTQRGLADRPLDLAVIDLKSPIGEAPVNEGSLLQRVAARLPKLARGQDCFHMDVDPLVDTREPGQRARRSERESRGRVELLLFGFGFDEVQLANKSNRLGGALITQLQCIVKSSTDMHHATESAIWWHQGPRGQTFQSDLLAVSLVVIALDEAIDRADVWRDGVRLPVVRESVSHKVSFAGETPEVTEVAALLVLGVKHLERRVVDVDVRLAEHRGHRRFRNRTQQGHGLCPVFVE